MKLPDFFKNSVFNKVRKELNIKEDEIIDLSSDINFKKLELEEAEFQEIESGLGLDISLEDLDIGKDNTITYKNKNVILYIRDQYSYDAEYKYHMSWCTTLHNMRKNNKLNRYVISRRMDGEFYVNIFDKGHGISEQNMLKRLNVCKYCLGQVNFKEYKTQSYANKTKIYENFSIEEFLKTYDTSFRQLPKYTDATAPVNEYPSNWKEISEGYRILKGYVCEGCKKDFSNNKGYLDVHHIDSNKFNVNHYNLKALCKDCHGEEYGHGHYKHLNKKRYNR